MREIKKIDLLSSVKIFLGFAVIGAVLNIILGSFIPSVNGADLTFLQILLMSVLGGLFWTVIGIIIVLIYNLLARYFGGIKLDL
jgi:hypothetical protein